METRGKRPEAKRAAEIRGRASDRRVLARRLPFDLAAVGAIAIAAGLAYPDGPGLWVYLAFALLLGGGGTFAIVNATRGLRDTLPEERGKRSDDKALAKAQRSLGCLPLLAGGAFAGATLFWTLNSRWPWQPWVVALGGASGHVVAVAVIQWSRMQHKHTARPVADAANNELQRTSHR